MLKSHLEEKSVGGVRSKQECFARIGRFLRNHVVGMVVKDESEALGSPNNISWDERVGGLYAA